MVYKKSTHIFYGIMQLKNKINDNSMQSVTKLTTNRVMISILPLENLNNEDFGRKLQEKKQFRLNLQKMIQISLIIEF